MPFKIIRNRDGSFKVKNLESGRLAAKKTTKTKAEAQVRLLNNLMGKEKWNSPPRPVIFAERSNLSASITNQRTSMEMALLTGVRPVSWCIIKWEKRGSSTANMLNPLLKLRNSLLHSSSPTSPTMNYGKLPGFGSWFVFIIKTLHIFRFYDFPVLLYLIF